MTLWIKGVLDILIEGNCERLIHSLCSCQFAIGVLLFVAWLIVIMSTEVVAVVLVSNMV